MNKISIYILLILLYLGFSKGTFSTFKDEFPLIANESAFSSYFKEQDPFSIILLDYIETGFVIKTYIHKYKIIWPHGESQIVIARVSKEFFSKHMDNIGLSIFRKNSKNEESFTPLPPFAMFVGDPFYGHWSGKGNKEWIFYPIYSHLVSSIGMGEIKINWETYKKMQIYLLKNNPFYGLNNEFGTRGNLTKVMFKDYQFSKNIKDESFKDVLLKLIRNAPIGK
ncbi:MAG: hypothetical protein HQK49_16550 [Oligoflexia bacterium]|nr:hypothetical protein [Oligoflexia bacterium]